MKSHSRREAQGTPSNVASSARAVRTLMPISDSIYVFISLSVIYAILVGLVWTATRGGRLDWLWSDVQLAGLILEDVLPWVLPVAFTFVALAHFAVIGGELRRDEHRGYMLALSIASAVVVAGVTVSALLVALSWLATPAKFVILVPLLPMLAVLGLVGIQVGRFNYLNAEQERRFLTRAIRDVDFRVATLEVIATTRAKRVATVHVLILVVVPTSALFLSGTATDQWPTALAIWLACALSVLIALGTGVAGRSTTDVVNRLAVWVFYALWATAVGVAVYFAAFGITSSRSWWWLALILPLALVFLSTAPVRFLSTFRLAGVADSIAARILRRKRAKLTVRLEAVESEIEPEETGRLRRTFRAFFSSDAIEQ